MKKIVFLCLVFFNHYLLAGGFVSGNDLHHAYSESPPYALGYVIGIADAYSSDSLKFLCLTPSVTKGQINDVVKKYLESNPQVRHFSASSIVWNALSEASFGCK